MELRRGSIFLVLIVLVGCSGQEADTEKPGDEEQTDLTTMSPPAMDAQLFVAQWKEGMKFNRVLEAFQAFPNGSSVVGEIVRAALNESIPIGDVATFAARVEPFDVSLLAMDALVTEMLLKEETSHLAILVVYYKLQAEERNCSSPRLLYKKVSLFAEAIVDSLVTAIAKDRGLERARAAFKIMRKAQPQSGFEMDLILRYLMRDKAPWSNLMDLLKTIPIKPKKTNTRRNIVEQCEVYQTALLGLRSKGLGDSVHALKIWHFARKFYYPIHLFITNPEILPAAQQKYHDKKGTASHGSDLLKESVASRKVKRCTEVAESPAPAHIGIQLRHLDQILRSEPLSMERRYPCIMEDSPDMIIRNQVLGEYISQMSLEQMNSTYDNILVTMEDSIVWCENVKLLRDKLGEFGMLNGVEHLRLLLLVKKGLRMPTGDKFFIGVTMSKECQAVNENAPPLFRELIETDTSECRIINRQNAEPLVYLNMFHNYANDSRQVYTASLDKPKEFVSRFWQVSVEDSNGLLHLQNNDFKLTLDQGNNQPIASKGANTTFRVLVKDENYFLLQPHNENVYLTATSENKRKNLHLVKFSQQVDHWAQWRLDCDNDNKNNEFAAFAECGSGDGEDLHLSNAQGRGPIIDDDGSV